jgi:hypothetical protein
MKTAEETKIEETAERIVNKEILCNQSALLDTLFGNGDVEGFTFDEIVNASKHTVEDHETYEQTLSDAQLEAEIERVEDLINNASDDEVDALKAYLERLNKSESEPVEILEWWLVSEWMAGKLREQGEPILDNDFGYWWGRKISGQSITMDGVILDIAADLNK